MEPMTMVFLFVGTVSQCFFALSVLLGSRSSCRWRRRKWLSSSGSENSRALPGPA